MTEITRAHWGKSLTEWLFRVHASVKDAAIRDKSRLLAMILIAMTLIFGGLDVTYLLTVPNYAVPWYGYALLVSAFTLNRRGIYQTASWLTIAMFPMVIFSNVISGDSVEPRITLGLLILGVMLGVILLTQRGLIALVLVSLTGIVVMPFAVPTRLPGLSSIAGPAATLIIGTILAFVFISQRDRLDRLHQHELRASKERLDLALEGSNLGTWDWDILTNTVQWSDNVASILGVREGEFKGAYNSFLEIIPAEERDVVIAAVTQTLQGPQDSYHVVHRVKTQDGLIRWIESSGKVYRAGDYQPVRMTGTVRDITERRRNELELKASEEKFLKAFYASPVAMAIQQVSNSHYIEVNDAFVHMTGLLRSEILGHRTRELNLFARSDDMLKLRREVDVNGRVERFEMEYHNKRGEAGYAVIAAERVQIHDEACNIILVQDITEQKDFHVEREALLHSIQTRNAHLHTATLVSKYCSSVLDPEMLIREATNLIAEGFELYYVGLFLTTNDVAVLKAGFGESGKQMVADGYQLALDEHSMIGWSILNRTARTTQKATNDNIRKSNPYLPETRSEMSIPLVSREKVIGALTVQSRVEDAFSEEDIAILQTMSDQLAIAIDNAHLFSDLQAELAQRRIAEAERESLIAELERKNTELERFTYTVSHDLKSPLITIRGFLGHLLDDAQRGDLVRMNSDAQRIVDATGKMQRLLDELLELSRVGRLVNDPEEIPFGILVAEALSLAEGRIASRGIKVSVAANLPNVRVDRVRFVEVIQNLLDNASKFMGDQSLPSIHVGVEYDSFIPIFFIRDNGLGIDPKFHQKIFGLFDKLDPSSEGTGIGLALVKRIIEVHSGRIWVESEIGKGATFFFTVGEMQNPTGS